MSKNNNNTIVCRNGSCISENGTATVKTPMTTTAATTTATRPRRGRRTSTTTVGWIVAVTVFLVTVWTLREPNGGGGMMSSSSSGSPSGRTATTITGQDDDLPSGPPFPKDATAACLLMFDDNLSLVEWIAYHYHTMRLRHVVLLTDPRSTESPVPILERWKTQGLTYEYWDDEARVFPSTAILQGLREAGDLVQLHRHRQSYFYARCMRELKERRQSSSAADDDDSSSDQWLLLTDVDEYVALNPHATEPSHRLYRPRLRGNVTYAPADAIWDFLRDEERLPACLHMARRDMVSRESTRDDVNAAVPSSLNATAFYTTRWRHQSARRITGKCLVNLRAVRREEIPLQSPRQGHVPLPRHCPSWGPKYFYTTDNTVLIVHHYLGTQTQYQYRDDPRRDRTTGGFAEKQRYPTRVQDTLRSWLPGFVAQVGEDEAQRLLQGAGTLGGGA